MSVLNRIRLVGAIATSIAVALAVAVLFGVWASVGAVPGTLSLGPAGALMGMLATTSICVAVALSMLASDGRLAPETDATQPLQPQTSYQLPTA